MLGMICRKLKDSLTSTFSAFRFPCGNKSSVQGFQFYVLKFCRFQSASSKVSSFFSSSQISTQKHVNHTKMFIYSLPKCENVKMYNFGQNITRSWLGWRRQSPRAEIQGFSTSWESSIYERKTVRWTVFRWPEGRHLSTTCFARTQLPKGTEQYTTS